MPVGDANPPAAEDPLVGTVVSDRYRIVRKVGEGGMGAVYQAEHAVIGKRVALKVLFADLSRRPELVARFLQEAKSASRIGHENVIDISDFGQTSEGLVYIAMEFLEGQDLGRALRSERTLPWARARGILMQIAKGLRAAHAQGIIHRDMKPENIFLVQRDGRPDFVKVLDFGIAKVVSADNNDGPRLTQTGMIFGTPEYMSPEQAQGQPPDHRVDVYAVGCIMYHMLTGAVPFHADSFMGILTKHLLEPVIPPRQRRPDLQIPADVEAVCLRALEKDRDKRWVDMDEFYRAIGAAGGQPFEPSTVRTYLGTPELPGATLKYPSLAQPNAEARDSRTAIAATPPVGAFDDERPSRPEPPRSGLGGRAKLALGAAAALVIVSVLVLALRGGPAPGGGVAAKAATAPAVEKAALLPPPVADKPATPPPAAAPPEKAEPPAPAPEAVPAEKPARARRRHGESDRVDPLHRKIDVPGDPTTPAELKNPFAAP
ncbi:MAG TPA: serine/threonine-protein kinase [Polyangia bacterium]|nr:serine/threonine-protein kinase [Polyangia bacterium]